MHTLLLVLGHHPYLPFKEQVDYFALEPSLADVLSHFTQTNCMAQRREYKEDMGIEELVSKFH